MRLDLPADTIDGSVETELRIYPNLLAHVLDAVDGIGRRPAGCSEQITSTAYVSLMALELLAKHGGAAENSAVSNDYEVSTTKAKRAVRLAVDMLKSRQSDNGGIAYWNGGESDLPLSAYVYRFLATAAEHVTVDQEMLEDLRDYLLARQQSDGGWRRSYYYSSAENETSDPGLTAYLARALATVNSRVKTSDDDDSDREHTLDAIHRALALIESKPDAWLSPEVVGNYVLAAAAAGHAGHFDVARRELERIEHKEGSNLYWNPEQNTTWFYGWGVAGRLEVSALAVQALHQLRASGIAGLDEKISQGLQFLLSHKDQFGVWYSTQATQNVLEAVGVALPKISASIGNDSQINRSASIIVNGKPAGQVVVPEGNRARGPIIVPLRQVSRGTNRIEIRGVDQRLTQVALVTSYYQPWSVAESTSKEAKEANDSRTLRLGVRYDQTEVKVGDTITCKVEAERANFRGYGMMLAEIGLPPGADVDRATLEQAARSSNAIQSYDVQPDRVVFYIWPQASGVSFSFNLKLRYAMEAMTAASQIYDYYNPEKSVQVAPVLFTAR